MKTSFLHESLDQSDGGNVHRLPDGIATACDRWTFLVENPERLIKNLSDAHAGKSNGKIIFCRNRKVTHQAVPRELLPILTATLPLKSSSEIFFSMDAIPCSRHKFVRD
jgi:hypothetical protein